MHNQNEEQLMFKKKKTNLRRMDIAKRRQCKQQPFPKASHSGRGGAEGNGEGCSAGNHKRRIDLHNIRQRPAKHPQKPHLQQLSQKRRNQCRSRRLCPPAFAYNSAESANPKAGSGKAAIQTVCARTAEDDKASVYPRTRRTAEDDTVWKANCTRL